VKLKYIAISKMKNDNLPFKHIGDTLSSGSNPEK